MKNYKVCVCGCGMRGNSVTKNIFCNLDYVEVVAVCDPYLDKAEGLAEKVLEKTGHKPLVFDDYKKALEESKPDAVFIVTAWEMHVEIAEFAMRRHIAVALEVGGAYGLEECYRLVNTYEETKTPFMFMENCCYNKDELLATSLVRNGVFGNVVYCHGAYRHDLRNEIAYGNVNRHYRFKNYINRNGDTYPTHDLGPIAKMLNIGRGNRMVSLVSMSSKAMGLHDYMKDREDVKDLKDIEFKQGDIVETLIKCENGEMISIKLDTTLPCYYSRELTVRGTKGLYDQNNNIVMVDGEREEIWDPAEFNRNFNNNAKEYEDKYLVDCWKNVTKEIIEAGHGGMDYFEFVEFFKALENGTEMPIDVYDAATWMSITCLSEESIRKGSVSVEIPDFTNGRYKTRKPKDVLDLPKVK